MDITRMVAADECTYIAVLYFMLKNHLICLLFLDCLRSFTDLEELDETELYMCHKCKKKQKSTKKFWIQKLPKVCISMGNDKMSKEVMVQPRPLPSMAIAVSSIEFSPLL